MKKKKRINLNKRFKKNFIYLPNNLTFLEKINKFFDYFEINRVFTFSESYLNRDVEVTDEIFNFLYLVIENITKNYNEHDKNGYFIFKNGEIFNDKMEKYKGFKNVETIKIKYPLILQDFLKKKLGFDLFFLFGIEIDNEMILNERYNNLFENNIIKIKYKNIMIFENESNFVNFYYDVEKNDYIKKYYDVR